MTINRYDTQSYDELLEIVEKLDEDSIPIYILFVDKVEADEVVEPHVSQEQTCIVEEKGSMFSLDEIKKVLLDANDGEDVEAVINEYLEYLPENRNIHYIVCHLTSTMWGPGTQICADQQFWVWRVPTLMRYKGGQRLEMSEVTRFPLLAMLFEEEDEIKPTTPDETEV